MRLVRTAYISRLPITPSLFNVRQSSLNMSTQLSTQSQSTSILSALNTAINFAADGVSKLTRLVPDTYHRHITDRSLPSDIHDVAPFVRYIESNASDKLMEIAHGELQALTDHESDSPGANLQQRLNWGKTIGDIESSFEGTNLSDAAVKSSMTVVQGWFYNGSSTPS